MTYTVAIIGLGNIGMLYDSDKDEEYCLTHSRAFLNHSGFNVKMMIDIDDEKLNLAKKLFRKNKEILFLNNLQETKFIPEIIVLSSSPKVNKSIIEEYYNNKEVKLFFVEKPFDKIKDKSDLENFKSKIKLNYFRKSFRSFKKIKSDITEGKYGNPLFMNCVYSKGLRNNGSHLLDLILFLFENFKIEHNSIKIISYKNDYSREDLSIGFAVEMTNKRNSFPIVFQIADENKFSLFECDIVFENYRIKLSDFGFNIETYKIENDKVYEKQRKFELLEKISINEKNFMIDVVDELHENLIKNNFSDSSLVNEFKIQQLIISVINKLENG